jgi:uroporphyrinogen-III decarboxylase
MNSREIIKTTMEKGTPDRVPFWCLLSLEHIIKHGMKGSKAPSQIEELIEVECRLAKEYNFDGSLVYQPGCRKGANIDDFINLAIREAPVGAKNNIFEDADPDSWAIDIPEYVIEDFYSSHLSREILGDNLHLGGWTGCGFTEAVQWFPSLEDAMMATILDPVKFCSLVNYMDELSIAWSVAQIKIGKLESIQISSPYAGSGFISSDAYKSFVLPSVTKISKAITKAGGFSYIHTCGSIEDRLELLAQSETDGIECLDPPPLGNVTLSDAKKRVGDKLFLKGNLDSVNLLMQGSDEEVEKVVTETIDTGKTNGAFILSSACSVSAMVNPDRIKWVSEINAEKGIY